MEAKPRKLVDYETADGKCPVRQWLDEIDNAVAARIEARLKRVELGNFGDAHGVGEGVSELRFKFGSGYRLYYGEHGEEIVVLLCGGDKGSQDKDIKTAQEYWVDFKRRNDA